MDGKELSESEVALLVGGSVILTGATIKLIIKFTNDYTKYRIPDKYVDPVAGMALGLVIILSVVCS